MTKGEQLRHLQLLHVFCCCSDYGKVCETHLKGPLSTMSLHAAIAKGKPALREQGVQPQGLLPVALSLQIKENLSAHQVAGTR